MLLRLIKNPGAYWRKFRKCWEQYPVMLPPYGTKRGTILFSYMTECLRWNENDERLLGHSNLWECRELVDMFRHFGFSVIAIDWNDVTFVPNCSVDILFDIHKNLSRLKHYLRPGGISWLYLTGSDSEFQNAAEHVRVAEFIAKKKMPYTPRRVQPDVHLAREALSQADCITLIGNETTRTTYPTPYRDRIRLVSVSGSWLGSSIKRRSEYYPEQREFIWFFGGGLVHKGLDLVLDVFARRPNIQLNIVGNLAERDFCDAYAYELQMPNIKVHGFMKPSSLEFKHILQRSFAFIAPSCSEGTAPAVVTCLQAGLYPIISRHTGTDLPNGCGIVLNEISAPCIEAAINQLLSTPCAEVEEQIAQTQSHALRLYSRTAFSDSIETHWNEMLITLNCTKD